MQGINPPQWNAPAALTKTDDTNVTLTLGGSASTALLNAASLTLGWTGQLSVSRGGTGLSTLAANYVPYGNGTSAFQSSANLQFNGTNLAVGGSFTTTVSNGIAINNATAGNYPGIEIQTAGVTRFFINATSGASYISSVGTNPTVFYTNSADAGRIHASGGWSIGNSTDPGATNLSVTGKVSVANTFESTAYVGINSSTATTIATGISFLAVVRDRGNGDTALVLYENNVTPVIISQTNASKFTTSAPGASQIQLANLSGGAGMTAKSGSTIGNDNLNITIIKNQ